MTRFWTLILWREMKTGGDVKHGFYLYCITPLAHRHSLFPSCYQLAALRTPLPLTIPRCGRGGSKVCGAWVGNEKVISLDDDIFVRNYAHQMSKTWFIMTSHPLSLSVCATEQFGPLRSGERA